MSKDKVTRAWKDEEYRNSLSAAERAAVPENPAGSIELSADELTKVSAGEEPTTGAPQPGDLATTYGTSSCDGTKNDIQCDNSGTEEFRGGFNSLRMRRG